MSKGASAVQPGPSSTSQSTFTPKETSFDSSASEIAQHSEWISKCRKILISTENINIASRVCHWRRIVNEKTDLTNERLNIFIPQNSIPKFEWIVTNLNKYIQFVIQWNGLKMKQIKNSPANYEEYERKARNWLNGRRAPNYAGTLFPDMIKSSEQYADTVSKQLFGPNNQYSKAYQKILMFGYLHALCSVRISMNDVSKKTFLLCENSIKTNSVTSVLLQQYATDHPFAQYFPSHLKQAADYFHNKFEMDIKRFGNALRLAAGNNMSVNQVNPTINTINNHIPSMNNHITGLNINDLNNLNSYYMHNIFNLNQANSSNTDHKSDLNSDKMKAKETAFPSPVSLTHSNGTTSTTSINTNPFHCLSSDSSSSLNPIQQIPNLSMPPQINTQINVNGKQQSVVSFLNQIVNTCNNQQIFMQNLQNRVQCMEQIIRHNNNININNNSTHLQPLPRCDEIKDQHLQFIIQPSMPSLSNPQFQFQGIAQQIQPLQSINVQQIRSSSSIPKQQFIVNSQSLPLPNMVATPSNAVSKPIQSIIQNNLMNARRNDVMDDESAAALLASLKHKIEPKIEPNIMNKRPRDICNNKAPPIKKRKIEKK